MTLKHLLFTLLVAALWWIGARLFKRMMRIFFEKNNLLDERVEETILNVLGNTLTILGLITVSCYLLKDVVDFSKFLAGTTVVVAAGVFVAQTFLRDYFAGLIRTSTKKIHKGDLVRINNTYTGRVVDMGSLFLTIREWSGRLTTINHNTITVIQNYNMDQMRVIERVVTSFREDPERVKAELEKVCEILNERYKDDLLTDESGAIVEAFHYLGMDPLNENTKGTSHIVIGLIKDENYFPISRDVRYEMQLMCYKENIRQNEENVFYTTRANK